MSFWDTLGEIAKLAPTVGAFDAARVAANTEDPEAGPDGLKENAKQFASAFFKTTGPVGNVRMVGKALTSEPVTSAMEPLVWTANQASHGFSSVRAMGGMLADSGQTGIDNLWSGDLWDTDNWRKAWEASDGISGGEALAGSLASSDMGFGSNPEARWWSTDAERQKFDEQRQRTGFRVGAGALDIMLTWYADPTIVAGKAAKIARTANRIVDAEQAGRVADIIGTKLDDAAQAGGTVAGRTTAEKAKGLFNTSDEEIANRLWDNVAKTDNMDFDQVANHFQENLRRTGDAGPIVGILGQAGRIKDVNIQRAVKADALLTAAGSEAARARLIQNAPEIARAVERVSQPPEVFQIVDDLVANKVTGQALLDTVGRWATPGNKKELEAYASTLDDIHTRIAATKAVGDRGGLEQVGGSVLGAVKSKYRDGMAQEFFFQPGPHARTVRVLHWATGQRMRGVIATDDAVRGHDELMDVMTRSGLFTADERKAYSSRWWASPTKADRTHLAQHLPEAILNKLAVKHFGGDRKMLEHVTSTYKGWAEAARTYTTKQMEEAVANNAKRVVLEEPTTGMPNSIDRALFETHIQNNVPIPDVSTLERLVRHAKEAGTLGDKVLKSSDWALKSAEDANDLWRTLTLGRPGVVLRTQLDTQTRSALAIGGMSVLHNAMKGLGHKIGDVLNGKEVEQVQALASDLLRQENLRREAQELRRQADVVDSGFGAARVGSEAPTSMPHAPSYDGGPALFHGTSERFPGDAVNPDPWGGSGSGNLFGYGFYTTDSRNIAKSYTRKGRGKSPVVYQVKWNGDTAPRVLDLEKSANPAIREWVGHQLDSGIDFADDDVAAIRKMMQDGESDAAVLNRLRGAMSDAGITSSHADEIYADMAEILSRDFDAIAHVGGRYAGRASGVEHGVKIWLDPSKVSVSEHVEGGASKVSKSAAAGSNSAAERLRRRAADLEAEAGKTVTYDATKRRLLTEDRTLDINGTKVTTRAAASDREAEGIRAAVHTGDVSLSDAITKINGQYNLKYTQDAKNWVTTMPDDPAWTGAWLRSKDALVGSKAGKAILEAMDEPAIDMIKHLRSNADVQAAWRQVRDQNPHFDAWLERAIGQAEWTAPTQQVRDALRSGRSLNEADVERMFKPLNAGADDAVGLAERMPVHAPAMDLIDPTRSGLESVTGAVKKFVGMMMDAPDTVLGRLPFYNERYFRHYRELAERELDRAGELGLEARAKIEKVARHRAIQDTRETMYDTARFTGAHDRVARMGFAFLGAWEDSMRAYGRLFYDDPARIGKIAKVWTAPERAGFVTDEKGMPVRPGEKVRDKWLTLPVSWIPGMDFKDFKIRKDSLNVIWQGDVPWAPGFAPGVQVPITQIAARAFPDIADPNFEVGGVKVGQSALFRQMFGFGLPKAEPGVGGVASSMTDQFTPGWMRRLGDVFDGNSDQFNDAYAMSFNSEIIKARESGKDPNSKAVLTAADAKARRTARSMMFMEFVSNFGLGLSGEGATTADFYRQRYQDISAREAELTAQGKTVKDEFLRQYPEAAGLKWSFSENETGINATLDVENRIRKYGKDIQSNPEFGWFYIGSDNVGGEFSQAAYAAQYGREMTPGSGQGWRSKQNSAQIRATTSASLGWDQYYKIKDEIDSALAARGLHSLQQKGAEDLNGVMKTFKSELMAENPDWAKDYNSFDAKKMDTFLSQVADPSMKDRRLKNRSDIKMMADYLALRDEAIQVAESRGGGIGSRGAYDLRQVLLQTGAQMAQENIGFSQMWQRVLSREIDLAQDDFPDAGQDTTQQASALGASIFK